jgi:hypothetical protein
MFLLLLCTISASLFHEVEVQNIEDEAKFHAQAISVGTINVIRPTGLNLLE